MEICADGHDEICYEGKWSTPCPACEAIKEAVGEKQEEIGCLQMRLDDIEAENDSVGPSDYQDQNPREKLCE